MNNGNNGKGSTLIAIVVVIIFLMMMGSCVSSNSDEEYKNTLKSGYSKYLNGEEMSKEEYNAVKGYNDWLDKQDNSKTYNEWNN